jgi:hypothetical protein
MADPITNLQGGDPTPDIRVDVPTVSAPQTSSETVYKQGAAPQPMVASSQTLTASPSPGVQTLDPALAGQLMEGGPVLPEAGVTPPSRSNSGVSQPFTLTSPQPIDTGFQAPALVAPLQTGNQQALQIVGPGIQRAVQGQRTSNAEMYDGALDPAAVGINRNWEPPDIDASISNFGSQLGVLRESYRAQTQQRQSESEKAWLDRNMAQIEAMSKPPGSATGNSMDWVSQMLGVSEDGNRTYTGAATFDKSKGEWVGSPVGGVLYAFGILQNSAMGAGMDIINTFRNVDKGLKTAYEKFTPPWARSSSDAALASLGSLFPVLKGLSNLPSMGKYDDGKSNFVEALRGAQYSFSDKAGSGLGLNFDKGFRLSTDIKDYTSGGDAFKGPKWLNNGKPGIDINPGVIVGIALDVVVGAKVDKLASKLGLLPKGISAPGPSTPRTPTPISPPPRSVLQVQPQPQQLSIPFPSGQVKSGPKNLPPVPSNLKAVKVKPPRKPPTTDVQTVLPISQMMPEFGAADRAIRPKAYKPGVNPDASGQLSLRLEGVERTTASRGGVIPKTPRAKAVGKQLLIEFDALPEAVTPKPSAPTRVEQELIRVGDDASLTDLSPAAKGVLYNRMKRQLETRLQEVQVRMSSPSEPDIGRRLNTSPPSELPPPPTISGRGEELRSIAVTPPPELFHGTRVKDLDIPSIDPVGGAAYSELGPGVYMTPDRRVAEVASGSLASEGLPGSKSYLPEGVGEIHTTKLTPDALILDGAKSHPVLTSVAQEVAQAFPTLRNVDFTSNNLVEILEKAAIAEKSQGGRQSFQEALTVALRNEGVDGVKMGDNLAVYNTSKVQSVGRESVEHATDPVDLMTNRAQLEQWGADQTGSKIATANALDSEAGAVSQRIEALAETRDKLAQQVYSDIQPSLSHPPRIPERLTTPDADFIPFSKAMETLPPGTPPIKALDMMATVDGKIDEQLKDILTAQYWDDLVGEGPIPLPKLKDEWADSLGVPRDTPIEDLAALDPSPSRVEAVMREDEAIQQALYCP